MKREDDGIGGWPEQVARKHLELDEGEDYEGDWAYEHIIFENEHPLSWDEGEQPEQ